MPPEPMLPEPPTPAILIVEDNAVNAMILTAMLRKRGFAAIVAGNGLEALALSVRHQPRLVFMDLQMPQLDGLAAAEKIRRVAGIAAPAIVAITANASPEVRAACMAAGFASLIAKPVDYEELMATVRRLLVPG